MISAPYHQTYNTATHLINFRIHHKTRSLPHFHKNFELACCLSGSATYVLKHTECQLQEGDCILFPPYQIHDCIVPTSDSALWITTFSPSLIKSFHNSLADQRAVDPVFHLSEPSRLLLKSCLIDVYPTPQNLYSMTPEQECTIKGVLYSICGEYLRSVTMTTYNKEAEALAFEILQYISNNFKENITLQSAAKQFGYNYHYLSKVFNQSLGYNFKTMLNQYRLEYAKQLLKETSQPITQIAFESGFQSQRTFNQVFEEVYGVSPSQLRKKQETH